MRGTEESKPSGYERWSAAVSTLHGSTALKGRVSCGGGQRATFLADGCITHGKVGCQGSARLQVESAVYAEDARPSCLHGRKRLVEREGG